MYHGEKLNSISHLVGAIFSFIALGSLLTVGIRIGTPAAIISFAVFGLSMALLYTASTLYHSFSEPHLKRKLKTLDHVAIYVFIAGTYTPFMLVGMSGTNGLFILGIVWMLALLGIVAELFVSGRVARTLQIIAYLGIGWTWSIDSENIRAALPPQGFSWLLTGGIAYTAGIVFYLIDKLKWFNHAHGIWHFFVLAGSVSHFISIIGFVR